ncbi:ABC transporter substrate-binding protein [Streptomyces litchfieldiae]|uniref:Sugar ABC transporter substrate-binding protein n=1 Tax=Streptomyces litchfieldiae TaxID=3075543 RepID=A0ABU2MYF9_9ACTN|nr:sugar ABC transporter substrate-binding protein [Streptomyces sp. DSM 44938]MDT0346685.1 sugar ABC transporter substrate-binding protein [Streptomyces sp. DSM 44938]
MTTTGGKGARAWTAGAAAAALTLSACGGGATGDGGGETVTYWLWDANQQPAYQECADDFEAAHPDIDIEIEQRGWDNYWTALALGFVSESAPDVFTDHLSHYPEYVTRDLLLPLDEFVERDDVPLDIYEEGLADLWIGEDGRRYGLPKDWDTVAHFYNADMTEEAGITEEELSSLTWNPEDGGTYEDVIARLTVDASGVRGDEPGFDKNNVRTYGLWLEMGPSYNHGQAQWSMYAAANGWEATDRNPWGSEFNYDDPAFQDTIAWWHSLIDKGYMPSLAAQEGLLSPDQLAAGNAAMIMNGSWMTSTIFAYEDLNAGLAPTPIGPTGERASMFNGLADSIWAGTDSPEASWEWVKYLASPACQRVVGEHHVVFPAITEAWEIARQRFAKDGIDVTPFTDHVENGTTFLFPITDHAGDIGSLMVPALESVMSGQAPVDSLTEVNEEVNSLFR